MKNRLPRPREMAVLIAVAVVCTVIVAAIGKYDVGVAFLGGPVFLVSALMGLRRSSTAATGESPHATTAGIDADA